MRVLVVVASMTLGLSGCIGGGIIHRAPAGNETAEENDPSEAVDQAPWQLNGTAGARDDAGKAGQGGAGGKGAPKGGGGQGGSGGSGDPDPGDNETEPPPDTQCEGLECVTEDAPTEGAASADDVLNGAEGTVEEASQTNTPKEPIDDPDDVSIGVPVKGGAPVPGAPKFPNTDPTMLA